MLCEERGFFLEIADIIRGMGLTILKGVMETRNDKIWARFAVEVNYQSILAVAKWLYLSCQLFLIGKKVDATSYLNYCIWLLSGFGSISSCCRSRSLWP